MMISKIRTGIKSKWSKGLLLFLFLALFGGFGMMSVLNKIISGKKDGVALVNGIEISKTFFARKKRNLEEQISGIYKMHGQMAPYILSQRGLDTDPEKGAMNQVVQESLINQVADKIPVYLSSNFLALKFKDPYFLIEKIYHLMPKNILGRGGKINIEAFNQFLTTYDLGPVEKDLEDALRQEIVLTLIGNASWVPQFAIDEMYKSRVQAKKYTIVTLPLEHFIKEEEKKGAEPKELKAFFDEQNNKYKRYYIPSQRAGTKWVFEANNFNISVSDKEVEKFYNKIKRSRFVDVPTEVKIREIVFDDVKNQGLQQLKEEAEKVKAELTRDPSQFEKLAKKYSTAESASRGGIVDFFKRGVKEKEIERAAFVTLKKDGDISEVIQLKQGYALVQRVSRKNATYKPLSKVKSEVKATLQKKKFTSEFQKKASRIVRLKGESADQIFKNFIDKNKAKEEIIPATSKRIDQESTRLFSIKKVGDKIAYIADGKGVILHLSGKTKKEVMPFEMMQKTIAGNFYEYHAHKALAKELKLQKEASLKAGKLVIPSWASSKKTSWLRIDDEKELKAYAEKGMPLDFLLLDKQGGIVSLKGKNDGFIVQLNEFKQLEENEMKTEKDKLKLGLSSHFQKLTMQAFIASLNRNATIEKITSSDVGSDYNGI